MQTGDVTIVDLTVEPLSVPLREPFVIASGRVDTTRAALVRATLQDGRGQRATGLGESAALPPVTREDQPDLLRAMGAAGAQLRGARLSSVADLDRLLAATLPGGAVARSGVETAILDAAARLQGVPLYRSLGGTQAPAPLITDITLSISDPERMVEAALRHAQAGFDCFKVKVGRDWRADCACLRAVAAAVPGARFRLDANAGFTAAEALSLLDTALADGLTIECYEQPCARRRSGRHGRGGGARARCPSSPTSRFAGPADLDRLLSAARAAGGVNLKLAKLGGPLAAVDLARRARAEGLRLMAGAMVETRLGLLAMAHVVAAVGGVDWVDLDTAFLLSTDPFTGGWTAQGPEIRLLGDPGLGVALSG